MPARGSRHGSSVLRGVSYAVGFAAAVLLWLLLGAGSAHADHDAQDPAATGPAERTAPLGEAAERLVREAVRPAVKGSTGTVRRIVASTAVTRAAGPVVEPALDTVEQVSGTATDTAVAAAAALEREAAPALPVPAGPGVGTAEPAAPTHGSAARDRSPGGAAPTRSDDRRPASLQEAAAAPAISTAIPTAVADAASGDVLDGARARVLDRPALPAPGAPAPVPQATLGAVTSGGSAPSPTMLAEAGLPVPAMAAAYVVRRPPAVPASAPDGLPACTPD